MKKIQISTDRVLLLIMAIIVWYGALVKACESSPEADVQPTVNQIDKDGIYAQHKVNVNDLFLLKQ